MVETHHTVTQDVFLHNKHSQLKKNLNYFLSFGCLHRKKCEVLTVLGRNSLPPPFSIQKLNSHIKQYYNLE